MIELEILDGESWESFLASDTAILMIGKTDCAACNAWTEELTAFLGTEDAARFEGMRFGKILLDTRGLASFKRAHGEWLKDVTNLPYNLIYRSGEQHKTWYGGGVERLTNRLDRLIA